MTLDFDSGTATINNNVLIQYAQDGFAFSISQTGAGSIGANLVNTLYCENQIGGAANCGGNDDGDLVPRVQGENGVAGHVLIRQEAHNAGNQNGGLDGDAATAGRITFTLLSGPAFWIRAFSAVDEQPMQLESDTKSADSWTPPEIATPGWRIATVCSRRVSMSETVSISTLLDQVVWIPSKSSRPRCPQGSRFCLELWRRRRQA